MKIEAHLVELENPFIPAQRAFEELVDELSGGETQKKTHSELENLINVRGIEVMRLLLEGHLEARGAGVSLIPVVNNQGKVLPYKRERGRALESVFGTVWVNRMGYEAKGESMLYPLDGDLNLPRERYSLGVRKRVWASLQKEPKEVIGEIFDEALSRDPNQQKQWIALVDGNKTQLDLLEQYAQKHSLQLTIILDLMHVLSYLWKAAHAFFQQGSKESEEWVS